MSYSCFAVSGSYILLRSDKKRKIYIVLLLSYKTIGYRMKHNLSVSVDEELVLEIFEALRRSSCKSKSEVVEKALRQYFENGR